MGQVWYLRHLWLLLLSLLHKVIIALILGHMIIGRHSFLPPFLGLASGLWLSHPILIGLLAILDAGYSKIMQELYLCPVNSHHLLSPVSLLLISLPKLRLINLKIICLRWHVMVLVSLLLLIRALWHWHGSMVVPMSNLLPIFPILQLLTLLLPQVHYRLYEPIRDSIHKAWKGSTVFRWHQVKP